MTNEPFPGSPDYFMSEVEALRAALRKAAA